MYAVVRNNLYVPARLAQGEAQMQAFQDLHARQPGYRGNLVIDAGGGRLITLTLWESREHADAAIPRLIPHIERLLEPMMAAESELVGTGEVIVDDLTQP
jgi:hypothetical protein